MPVLGLLALPAGAVQGTSFRDCEVCPEMVVVPAGSFIMGSPPAKVGKYSSEAPPHRVHIARPFAVGRFEVTFEEWGACTADGGCYNYRPDDEGWGRGRRPVINVPWLHAMAYVRWLSNRTGKTYRLLSEAEWEYAARAGTTTEYAFGDTLSADQARFGGGDAYAEGDVGNERSRTVPVGRFPPNRFGLHDMHGNVWEWVEDCWHGNYQGAPVDGSVWDSDECGTIVLRGGSWFDIPADLRSARRWSQYAWFPDNATGLRVARTLEPDAETGE